jgi:hypothetical protein
MIWESIGGGSHGQFLKFNRFSVGLKETTTNLCQPPGQNLFSVLHTTQQTNYSLNHGVWSDVFISNTEVISPVSYDIELFICMNISEKYFVYFL